jgi:putative DNA primase/helicase
MEGKTTEAGIRQQLCQDARPIVFDEAEAEDEASARRMQSILDLARVASSGGKIIKGTQSGTGVSFSVRSCFCFSSINTSVQHFADESRINKLVLTKDISKNSKEKYDELDKVIKETFTPEYSAAMLARSVKYLTILQKNCVNFIDAATRVFGSRRLADQMGTLLAGYYMCHSVKEISSEEAEKWMKQKDWSEHTEVKDRQDEQRLIDYIATRRIRVEDAKGFHDVNIGELILCANHDMDIINQEAADRELKRHGLMIDFNHVLIANNCQPMKELLRGTPWSSDWARPLKDLYNAEATTVKYFAPGIKSRAVRLPLDLFKEDL